MGWRAVPMLLTAAIASGCSDTYPVQGKVQFSDGTPLAAGTVFFTDERGISGGYAPVGPDGSFEVTYDEPGDGLPKGTYVVSVRPPSPWSMTDAQKKTAPPRGGIALKYLQPETSEIKVRIDGKTTDLVIQLEPDKALARSGSQK
jgi:hypothetical protein